MHVQFPAMRANRHGISGSCKYNVSPCRPMGEGQCFALTCSGPSGFPAKNVAGGCHATFCDHSASKSYGQPAAGSGNCILQHEPSDPGAPDPDGLKRTRNQQAPSQRHGPFRSSNP
jgi:hypothetical protein